ncbi:hypothetical protein [Pseudomonas putida]|uniref:Uncharacterized protein n=1 Tax=Pseudomonas putida TaxID=303 RepID=A0A8I1EBM2_PSEPU|nr:hypothetical protein [Pseudomonas putida]MBI6883047.1 hypothetical protein [Pseudomonas putida]
MVERKNLHDALQYLKVAASQLDNQGITSYCQQICGGGMCGTGPICQEGIDPETEMPSVLIGRLK